MSTLCSKRCFYIRPLFTQTVFPTLVVSPLNLIAACSNCNKIKGDSTFNSMSEATIHPYFDDIDTDIWLFANILQGDDISSNFFVSKPHSWSELLYSRVKNHLILSIK